MKVFSLFLICFSLAQNAVSQELSLENIWNSKHFNPESVRGFKMFRDGSSYTKIEKDGSYFSCVRYDLVNGNKMGVLFNTSEMGLDSNFRVESYDFSSDGTSVLVTSEFEAVYRHSGKSTTYLFNLNKKVLTRIGKDKLMYPTLSPDGTKVAYVKENNLFVFDIKKGKEYAVTKDGKKNFIINGAVDWVYEEEFSMSRGFEWSPDGQYIAYYRFDEEEVPYFSMDIYGKLYPDKEVWKYPKAGEKNSTVDVYIHKVGSKRSTRCKTGSENDQYLPRMKWDHGNFLLVHRLNRHQNLLHVLRFSPLNTEGQVLYTEENSRYVDLEDWMVNENSDSSLPYALFLSEKAGFKHIYKMDEKGVVTQVTKGNWDVDVLYGAASGKIYFSAAKSGASQRQIYSIRVDGTGLQIPGPEKGCHSAHFSTDFRYFLDVYSTFEGVPQYVLKDNAGKIIRILEDNKKLTEKLSKLAFGKVEFGSFTSTENVKLDYWKMYPANYSADKKYPVLFFVYGGPGHQTVMDRWGGANYLWYRYMASQGYIVISIDNRGSGGHGEEFKKMTYLNLGKYETQDYIAAAQYFGNQPDIDKTRIGIFGWSYGGFMASNCISMGADYFKTAVAVAPVTNWRYYDNIYTERYMRTPNENSDGYDQNSPLSHIKKIKGNYLIIHGTADDNVHFQNTAEMMMAMNLANIPYESACYPNTNHSIRGGKTRLHLFSRISTYLLENL